MKQRPFMAIIICICLCLSVVHPISVPVRSGTASVGLSATLLKIPANKSKVLKMKNTSRAVTWSIQSGKHLIALKNKKKSQVTIKAKKKGTAVVKAVIRYSSRKTKTYTCKVKVTNSQWECPVCGFVNTSNYCQNCGHGRPTPSPTPWLVWPTPTPTGSAAASTSPSPTPVSPEAMTQTCIVMSVNQKFYFSVQMYANQAATSFYKNVVDRGPITYIMGPDGEDEKFGYLEIPISGALSKSYNVSAGELFLYGDSVLKLSIRDHDTGALPTRIGKVVADHVDMLEQALQQNVDGKTIVEFRQYI